MGKAGFGERFGWESCWEFTTAKTTAGSGLEHKESRKANGRTLGAIVRINSLPKVGV